MSSPGTSPWNLVPPRRPGSDDFNGIAKVDDARFPPNPQTMPSAAEYNTGCSLDVGFGRMVPNLRVSVTGGTTPTVSFIVCMVDALNTTSAVTITRNSIGDVSITTAANALPAPVSQPSPSLNSLVAGRVVAANIANGVRVLTFDASGAAADLNFTVEIW